MPPRVQSPNSLRGGVEKGTSMSTSQRGSASASMGTPGSSLTSESRGPASNTESPRSVTSREEAPRISRGAGPGSERKVVPGRLLHAAGLQTRSGSDPSLRSRDQELLLLSRLRQSQKDFMAEEAKKEEMAMRERKIRDCSDIITRNLQFTHDPDRRRLKFFRMLENLKDIEENPVLLKEMRERVKAVVKEQLAELTLGVEVDMDEDRPENFSKRRNSRSAEDLLESQMRGMNLAATKRKQLRRSNPGGNL
jgi:hypothetical protein